MLSCLAEKGVTIANYDKLVLQVVKLLYGERGAQQAWSETLIPWLPFFTQFKFV